ncbi:TIGR03960 family B12-binding radical SAM protein [Collinsella sp. AGMB00827]|uniref:TIGR03960 family B12-binding radical SAM protein n=1 Tax=Collinsella ureilytica TaxID=2869515 RepID=A0ABS7ML26_9ACTN|nr:TIGR03960 family B12-binding radical SAM protein [Collinsella urealyticum]MBY4798064.1 TIGR03960 family B12-binding radical SAM protein [Collinsella urealyticum]
MARLSYRSYFSEIEPLLDLVEKPTRYINHEWGASLKSDADFRICMIYPDLYEVGLPNQGIAILYRILNAEKHLSCERGYLPWVDMADLMRERKVPLLSLEGAAPVASFDVVGFHIPHEMAATNYLEALDLAGIPLYARDRAEDDPIVIAGGPSVYNPEPLAPFIDAFLIGEGEESIVEVCSLLRRLRQRGEARQTILRELAHVAGTYVPALYEVIVDESSTAHGYVQPREDEDAPAVVYKRVITDFGSTDALSQTIVPFAELVHDRLSIEILRGCARGCRFCQAGITYRPVRERTPDQIVSAVSRGLAATGYDEVSLTSLSTTDHSQCQEILRRLNRSTEGTGTRISIPSQRLDSFGVDMALEVAGDKLGGLTFAPEAGSQRLRDCINKNVTQEDLERAARAAFSAGWNRMKLYFMMGLPEETDEDIQAIAKLGERVLEIGRELVPPSRRGSLSVTLSVSVFIPKPHTPFQWCAQLDDEEVKRRQQLLYESVSDRAVRVRCHDAETSLIEAVLSRMGQDAAPLIEGAWKRGQRFDAWTEQFSLARWEEAAQDLGMNLKEIAQTPFPLTAHLPWEHVSPGVSRGFLEREYRRALAGQTTEDCTMSSCTGCGICPTLEAENVLVGARS